MVGKAAYEMRALGYGAVVGEGADVGGVGYYCSSTSNEGCYDSPAGRVTKQSRAHDDSSSSRTAAAGGREKQQHQQHQPWNVSSSNEGSWMGQAWLDRSLDYCFGPATRGAVGDRLFS